MEEPIKEYISITIEVILIAAILGVAIIFASASRTLFNVNIQEKDYQRAIEEYKDIYMYDNKQLTGSDVAEALLKYTRYYSFEIVIDGQTHTVKGNTHKRNGTTISTDGNLIWTQEYIMNSILVNNTVSKFRAKLVPDKYEAVSEITGIQFIKE